MQSERLYAACGHVRSRLDWKQSRLLRVRSLLDPLCTDFIFPVSPWSGPTLARRCSMCSKKHERHFTSIAWHAPRDKLRRTRNMTGRVRVVVSLVQECVAGSFHCLTCFWLVTHQIDLVVSATVASFCDHTCILRCRPWLITCRASRIWWTKWKESVFKSPLPNGFHLARCCLGLQIIASSLIATCMKRTFRVSPVLFGGSHCWSRAVVWASLTLYSILENIEPSLRTTIPFCSCS